VEPWLSELVAGRHSVAWDLFLGRYRRLILATIKRLVHDHDDIMDVFSTVCQALSDDDCARLKRYVDAPRRGASFSTWLVIVVRNLTIDWLRKRDGRRRHTLPPNLSPLQQRIYQAIVFDGKSQVEAYEQLCTETATSLTFTAFLREVRETYRLAPRPLDETPRAFVGWGPDAAAEPVCDPAETAESARRIAQALASLPPDVRLAVELFVVEHMSAADVARAIGWPNAKAVYNRVHRALAAMRALLEREGISLDDLR